MFLYPVGRNSDGFEQQAVTNLARNGICGRNSVPLLFAHVVRYRFGGKRTCITTFGSMAAKSRGRIGRDGDFFVETAAGRILDFLLASELGFSTSFQAFWSSL